MPKRFQRSRRSLWIGAPLAFSTTTVHECLLPHKAYEDLLPQTDYEGHLPHMAYKGF